MNVFGSSECSSGCESGWTLYLEQSFLSANPSHKDRKSGFCSDEHHHRGKEVDVVVEEDEEEEDLSMVSDASSGPPVHFYEDSSNYNNNNHDFGYFNDQYTSASKGAAALMNKNGGKIRHRNKEHRRRRCREEDEQLPSFLDDTASSPLIKNNFGIANNQASMESVYHYPQGFSATQYFQGGSAFQGHFGFLQSAPSGDQIQNNQWF